MIPTIKAIISDFDGTMVNRKKEFPPGFSDKVKSIQQKGIHWVIATGRPFHGFIEYTCRTVGLNDYQIVNGGAIIVNPHTKQPIWAQYLSPDDTTTIIKYCTDHKLYFALEGEDTIYTPDGLLKDLPYSTGYQPDGKPFFQGATIPTQLSEPIPKMIIGATKNRMNREQAEKVVTDLKHQLKDVFATIIKSSYSDYYGIDFTSLKASKHIAVLEWAKLNNLSPQSIVGIGDGHNDYPLLTACGYKIAMGNAPDELKEISNFVSEDVEHGGFFHALRHLKILS